MVPGWINGAIMGFAAYDFSPKSFGELARWPTIVVHGTAWSIARGVAAIAIDERSRPFTAKAVSALLGGIVVVAVALAAGFGFRLVAVEAVGTVVYVAVTTLLDWIWAAVAARRSRNKNDKGDRA